MKYQISETENGLSGKTLVVRFPDKYIDRKALNTIYADPPDFLIPFAYRNVEGEAECLYHLDRRTKLKYDFGEKSPADCVRFWEDILQPLLDCDDWFMNPLSFVLNTEYIYTLKGHGVSYLYIPSQIPCCTSEELKSMAVELSKANPSKDKNLEIEILRFVMQDFHPKAFLQMLRKSTANSGRTGTEGSGRADNASKNAHRNNAGNAPQDTRPHEMRRDDDGIKMPNSTHVEPDNGGISFYEDLFKNPDKKAEKKKRGKKEEISGISEKKPSFLDRLLGRTDSIAEEPPKNAKKSKRTTDGEILGGAAKDYAPPRKSAVSKTPVVNVPIQANDDDDELTKVGGPHFILSSRANMPFVINVDIAPGQTFKIARGLSDIASQSEQEFYFPKATEGVSRGSHAVISRTEDGYTIEDLNSKAGTFLDRQPLLPNIPQALYNGCQVSFGTGGADYTWWESSSQNR